MERIKQTDRKIVYVIFTVAYWAACIAARQGIDYLAGGILIITALFLYLSAFSRSGCMADLEGLFSISWVGGIGIACLKLSRLQKEWSVTTWVCFYLAYAGFVLAYQFAARKNRTKDQEQKQKEIRRDAVTAKRVFICCVCLTAVSVACFVLEAVVVGFIPLFSDMPHAYSYFHISGVHYFTISCILVPALTVLYSKIQEKAGKISWMILGICNLTAVAIQILCVSRFQLLFAVGFAVVTYVMLYQNITWKKILILIIVMIPVYVALTVARRHSVSYLNGIFEMKNSNMPIFITQPYIYVANNFENFNCLVEQLPKFTYGIRMLFPFFALTGLKFVIPWVTQFPNYVTKTELTTFTMFYDAYYDFGAVGVLLLAMLLGVAAGWLTGKIKKSDNPMIYLFYGELAIYLGLSFFTTWLSNPTMWFWFAVTLAMYWFIGRGKKKGRGENVGTDEN